MENIKVKLNNGEVVTVLEVVKEDDTAIILTTDNQKKRIELSGIRTIGLGLGGT